MGFLLLSAGCAIGLGNVWKFPYITGENGGGAFVLIYIIFLLLLGIPILTMEFTIGRASRKSPAMMEKELEPKGSKWHLHGPFCTIGCWMLMMFYTVVAGWMLAYFIKSVTGELSGLDAAGVENVFNNMVSDPWYMFIFTFIVIAIGFFVCSFDLRRGLERITKVLMIGLLVIVVALVIHSLTLSGAGEGLNFYLNPDFGKMADQGVGNVVIAALSQAFFTLSIGIGSMAIFGSYINKDRSLLGEATSVTIIDTFIAICAGLIIFPACFTYDVSVGAGPSLIFVTLPNVFNNMPGGQIWGSLFFLFMTIAALTTVLAVFEAMNACTQDYTGFSRKKTSAIHFPIMILLAIPCILGFNILSGFQPFGAGSNVLDLEDFIVSTLLLPIGGLVFALFCTWRYGWGWDKFKAEANEGKGLKIAEWMRPYLTYILPIIIVFVLVAGLLQKFGVI